MRNLMRALSSGCIAVLVCAGQVSSASEEQHTLRGVQHIGLTVPNLEEAIDYFVNVIGCDDFFGNAYGPFDNDWLMTNIEVHSRATLKNHRVRCGDGANLEIFEYNSPDQRKEMPKNSDYGGTHIAFYVDDLEATVEYLRNNNIEILGGIKTNTGDNSPAAGLSWIYTKTPWGAYVEFLSFPNGLGYEKMSAHSHHKLWSPVE